MSVNFKNAWGYQDDAMNLPVANVDEAAPFYTDILGFEIAAKGTVPVRSVIFARPDVQFAIAENGGDPTQDGCAFEVGDVEKLFAEFRSNGLEKEISEFAIEENNGTKWKAFYVVAPDGLCYWLGEKLTS